MCADLGPSGLPAQTERHLGRVVSHGPTQGQTTATASSGHVVLGSPQRVPSQPEGTLRQALRPGPCASSGRAGGRNWRAMQSKWARAALRSSPRGARLYRIVMGRVLGCVRPAPDSRLDLTGSKIRQNLSVSSAEAEHTMLPQGLWARASSLWLWPIRSADFVSDGYLQRDS